ncbi:hypothetical protein FI667_g1289, partial [Globisporangium splendens]
MVKSGKRLKATRPTWLKVLAFSAIHAALLSPALAVPNLVERQLDVVTCPVTLSRGVGCFAKNCICRANASTHVNTAAYADAIADARTNTIINTDTSSNMPESPP